MPTSHVYVRVSSDRQAEEGLSVEGQIAKCKEGQAALRGQGLAPGEVYADLGVSATDVPFIDRPAVMLMLTACRPGDVIVTLRMDRMFRDPADHFTGTTGLARQGVKVYEAYNGRMFDQEDPAAELAAGMLALVARFEVRLKALRVSEAVQAALDRGEYPLGSIPLGWKRKRVTTGKRKYIIPDPEQEKLLDVMTAVAESHGWYEGARVLARQNIRWGQKEITPFRLCERVTLWKRRRAGELPPTVARMLRGQERMLREKAERVAEWQAKMGNNS